MQSINEALALGFWVSCSAETYRLIPVEGAGPRTSRESVDLWDERAGRSGREDYNRQECLAPPPSPPPLSPPTSPSPPDPPRYRGSGVVTAFPWIGEKLWHWEVVGLGATVIFSAAIPALYADDYTVALTCFILSIVWFSAKLLSWQQTRGNASRKLILAVVSAVAIWGTYRWVSSRRESEENLAFRPIRIDNIVVNAHSLKDTLVVAINLTNLSKKQLRVKEIGQMFLRPKPQSPFERERVEDELWQQEILNLNSRAIESKVPTAEDGE